MLNKQHENLWQTVLHKAVWREDGKEQVMRVHYDEGTAIHIGPDPCNGVHEGDSEVSAGQRIAHPLSRKRFCPEC